jgi:hypothetical protein
MPRVLSILAFALLTAACLGATPTHAQTLTNSSLVVTSAVARVWVTSSSGDSYFLYNRTSNDWFQVSSSLGTNTVWLNLSRRTAKVYLAWSPAGYSGITGYNVYLGITSGVYAFYSDVGTNLTATIAGLVQGNTYYVSIAGYYATGAETVFWPEVMYVVPFDSPRLIGHLI